MRSKDTSHDRSRDVRSTIVDKDCGDYRPLAKELGLTLADGHPAGGFSRERDWFFNAKGRNVPAHSRWLVTLAHADTADAASADPDPEAPATGWLIAYEIDPNDSKTNRVIVLAGPWNLHTDKTLYAECPLSDPDLDALLSWLGER